MSDNKQLTFCGHTPCVDCPYRKDAPLQKWSKVEFEKLIDGENSYMGTVYGCHKNNGNICVGWLMNQDENNVPSIALRIALAKNKVSRLYLDSLKCKSERFGSVLEMAQANYPDSF